MLWSLVAGVALGAVVAMVLPGISIRRNRRRAKEAGAIWVGMANFEASDPGTDPTVQAAFAQVGSMYFSRSDASPRLIGGLLYVTALGMRWEPGIWLGRGEVQPWSLGRESIVDVEVRKMRFPAMRTYEALLRTSQGTAKCIVVDPAGLQAAVSSLAGR